MINRRGRELNTLSQEELRHSENLAIRELVRNDFYIMPAAQDSFVKDIKRSMLQLDVFGQLVDQSVLSSSQAVSAEKELIENKVADVYAQYQMKDDLAKEHLAHMTRAYRQKCTTIVVDALEASFAENNAKLQAEANEVYRITGKTVRAVVRSVPAPGYSKGTMQLPTQSFKAEECDFDINETLNGTKVALAAIQGSAIVMMELTAVTPEQYAEMLHIQKQDYLSQGFRLTSQKVVAIDKIVADVASYPKQLYRLHSISTDSKFIKEVLMKLNSPEFVHHDYQEEILLKPKSTAAKVAVCNHLCRTYEAYYGEKIKDILKKETKNDFLLDHVVIEDDKLLVKSALDSLANDSGATIQIAGGKSVTIGELKAKNKELKGAIEKYQSIQALYATLNSKVRDDIKLQNFAAEVAKQKPTLTANFDNAGKFILKCVATVLSFGVACAFGLWRTRGDKFVDQAEKKLNARLMM